MIAVWTAACLKALAQLLLLLLYGHNGSESG